MYKNPRNNPGSNEKKFSTFAEDPSPYSGFYNSQSGAMENPVNNKIFEEVEDIKRENEKVREKAFELQESNINLEEDIAKLRMKLHDLENKNILLEKEILNSRSSENIDDQKQDLLYAIQKKKDMVMEQSHEISELNKRLLEYSGEVSKKNNFISELQGKLVVERQNQESSSLKINDLERNLEFYQR